jgi:F-type H+-transporting ATPase subunit b
MIKALKSWRGLVVLFFLVLSAVLGGIATESVEDANIWILASFICFMVLFGPIAYKRIVAGLDGRIERIRRELDEAQKLREDAQALLDDYRSKRAQAEADALRIVEHAQTEAERRAAQGRRELEAAMERRAQMALQRIGLAEADALKEVRAVAAHLAVQATGRLIAETLARSPERAEAMVQDSIHQVQQKLH